MGLLPLYENGKLQDGNFLHALPSCLKKCNTEKCRKHYEEMKAKSAGFYTCPNGMSTLVYELDGELSIFSGVREKESYLKKKASNLRSEGIFNPVLNSDEILALAEMDSNFKKNKEELERTVSEVNDLLHEARKLNGQIKNDCELAFETDEEDMEKEELLRKLQDIHVCSFIINNRFQYYDLVRNPNLSLGNSYKAVIFKKFDKMRKLLRDFERKNVRISLNGQSAYSYKIFQSFETLLFIILENAIKYSPKKRTVDVNFSEPDEDRLVVKIESVGPYCREDELKKIGTKGFRGYNAQKCDVTGQGMGLAFAREICDQHHIDISFDSANAFKDHGISYGPFTVTLSFDHNNQPD